MPYEILPVLIIILIASTIRSGLGFGDALIAMPLLALYMPIPVAAPIVSFGAIIVAVVIILKDRRKINFAGVSTLIVGSVVGIPVGILFMKIADESIVKIALAVILAAYAIYNLASPRILRLAHNRFAIWFGLLAGALGGAYNTNGPPIIVYGTLRGWKPLHFRALLQSVFLPTNIFISIGHGVFGLWTPEVFTYFAIALPAIALGIFSGMILNRRIDAKKFAKVVYVALLAISAVLAWDAIKMWM